MPETMEIMEVVDALYEIGLDIYDESEYTADAWTIRKLHALGWTYERAATAVYYVMDNWH